ncbi:MAG: outer membrane protein assembly factor BamB [Salinisphaera sp.]|jgi:outer membrane protein assembly factor BamB|nr:outer membrane protein assembly factor BamB [Salinisphaera sp.]
MIHRRRTFLVLLPLLAAATLVLSGCGGGSTIAQPKKLTKLPTQTYRMQVLWHSNGGEGAGKYASGFVPAVADGRVYVANHDGEVVAFNLDNGRRLWHTQTDTQLISGPTAAGDRLFVGSRNGHVLALDADNGKTEWNTDLSSEVIAAPAATSKTVVVRTTDGHVAALNAVTGDRIWAIEGTVPNLTMRGTSSPVIDGNTIYVGMDSGKVLALDLATGEQRWDQTVAIPQGRSELDRIVDVDADPLVDGQSIYAASAGGTLAGLTLQGGQIVWKADVSVENNLAADSGHVYATDLNSVVWGINRSNGESVWKQSALEYRRLSPPAIVDGKVLVGDYEGYLHWLSPDNGTILARGRPFTEAIHAQPVVVGKRAIVLGAGGEVAAVRFLPNSK